MPQNQHQLNIHKQSPINSTTLKVPRIFLHTSSSFSSSDLLLKNGRLTSHRLTVQCCWRCRGSCAHNTRYCRWFRSFHIFPCVDGITRHVVVVVQVPSMWVAHNKQRQRHCRKQHWLTRLGELHVRKFLPWLLTSQRSLNLPVFAMAHVCSRHYSLIYRPLNPSLDWVTLPPQPSRRLAFVFRE